MPKKARLNPQRTEGKRKGCWEPNIKAGQIIFITVLQSLLALGSALPGKTIDHSFSEGHQQKRNAEELPDKSDKSKEETRNAIYGKLISLTAFEPHKLNAKVLSEIINSRTKSKINTKDDAALRPQKINQLGALLFFYIGEQGKFSELTSRPQHYRQPMSEKDKLRKELIAAARATIDGDLYKSEIALQAASAAFFKEDFTTKIEKMAYGRIFTELLAIYINPTIGHSLNLKILIEAINEETLNCVDKNHLKIQLRDAYLEQIKEIKEDTSRAKLIQDLPKMDRDCLYNKEIVYIQDAIASAINKLILNRDITDSEEIWSDKDGYELLKASLIVDPQSSTIQSIVETNKLYGSTTSVPTNKLLASLILSDEKAETIFKESTSPHANTAMNRFMIAIKALELTNGDATEYSQKDKDKALELAKFAAKKLITTSTKHPSNHNIAWVLGDVIAYLLFHLNKNELESLAKIVEGYIANINLPESIQTYTKDTIYLAYIVSEDFENAARYGSKIQDLGLKAWKRGGIDIPNAGNYISPEDIEYLARSGGRGHFFLIEKIADAKYNAQKDDLYDRVLRLAIKDIINKKGLSIDLLKRRSKALNSGKFTNKEISLLEENIYQPSIYPFKKSMLDQELKKRLLESRLKREMIDSTNGKINNEVTTINQVSKALKPGELLVEYVRDGVFYYIITLNHEGKIFMKIAGKEGDIENLVDSYLSDLANIKSPHKSSSSKDLKDFLLTPIEDKLLTSQVVYISPDASLHKIPFHLVISDQDNESSFPTTRLVTSGRDLMNIEKKTNKGVTTKSVVLANPDFDFNPANRRVTDAKSGQSKWIKLSGTAKEGEEISNILGVTYTSQKKATKQFLQAIQSPEILHIATHAFYNQEGKDLRINSGMVFAGANNLPPEESIMSPEEISVLDLEQTRLSVLSACETGIGAVLDGGSIASIQRAFTIAGSQSVINTLWKVDDYSTRAFMKSFYTNLKSGMSLEDSLSTTREYFQRHPIARWRDPYFWAAFQLYGYWGPIF